MKSLVWLKNSFKSYWSDEEGQTSLEYILLVAVVVAIIMKFKSKVSGEDGVISKLIDEVFGQKVQDILK